MSRDAEMASVGFDKSPFDWYVEPEWVTEALIEAEATVADPHSWGRVWDPACGMGNVLRAFIKSKRDITLVHVSDIEYRGFGSGLFQALDFLGDVDFVRSAAPKGAFSIVSNPPYSYKKGISEAFARRALELATERVAMLLPVKWQASQIRHKLFTEFPPSRIWILSERPSMPPGAMVKALGDKAFKRGKVDYMWVVWDRRNPAGVGETKWATIAARAKPAKGAARWTWLRAS